jgi:hypothetical protein
MNSFVVAKRFLNGLTVIIVIIIIICMQDIYNYMYETNHISTMLRCAAAVTIPSTPHAEYFVLLHQHFLQYFTWCPVWLFSVVYYYCYHQYLCYCW